MRKRGNGRGDNPWKSGELTTLRRLAGRAPVELIAADLERTVKSVQRQAERQRISLRVPGETRGRLLGQPRGTSLLTDERTRLTILSELRADVIAGRADLGRIERRVRLANRGAPLCPKCGKRPIEVATTGLCEDCHLEGLAWAHRLEADRLEAGRELDAQRQRKHRAKRRG